MTVTFYQKMSKLIELIAPYNRSEFYELLIVITRLSNPNRTRFTLYNTPKVMGQFERPRGRLNGEEVPQDLICAENVKNSMENFSFGNDSIISSKRLSDC